MPPPPPPLNPILTPDTTPVNILQYTVLFFLMLYFILMYSCFSTVNPIKARSQERERNAVESKYRKLFNSRDETLHHLGWARERKDKEGVDRAEKRIKDIDEEIDEQERDIVSIYTKHGVMSRQMQATVKIN